MHMARHTTPVDHARTSNSPIFSTWTPLVWKLRVLECE